MDTFLSVRHVSRTFPGIKALDKVSFDVTRGTIHALVGANGAGKSTMMKILSGALAPDEGEILLDGKPYRPANPAEAIQASVSTIYQELNLLNLRTITANVNLGREPRRWGFLDEREAERRTTSALERLGAAYLPTKTMVGELKVGEKQIIEIAKALVSECRLLIMDEPTAALNDQETNSLFAIIRELKAGGVTILYVSHRLKEIFMLADQVTILRDGKSVHTAPIAEVTPDSLIGLMLGRKYEGAFPEKNRALGEEILCLEGLSSPPAFDQVNFSLHRGEVLGITGLAGSGKVELGRALIGDWPIANGHILLHGQQYRPDPSRAKAAHIGYMPEDRKKEGVLEELSVRRNIGLPSLAGLSNRFGWIDAKGERCLAQKEVDDLAIRTPSLEQLVRNLSGGNQQKVSLAKWMAIRPELLLLVEPTQGIDVGVKMEIYRLIHEIAASSNAILLVSSEIPELLGLAHRILVLNNGAVQGILDGDQTNEEEILQYTFGQKRGEQL
ncbi:MAG TPA: sugar ABC transporter ATP-binding protein [Anaerolineaceae bacterium]|nr:sugar ABC transporter ATP-binding protein [Anaerolineaceae bacterium]